MKLLLLVPAQISELLIKLSTVFQWCFDAWQSQRTFIIQPVSEFCDKQSVAEKALSVFTDLGSIVIKAYNSFSRLFLISSLWPQKDSFPLSQFVIGPLPVPE